jgi:hypothetical protein
MGGNRQRRMRELLAAIQDPWDLAFAALVLAPSTAFDDIEPLREAALRLQGIDTKLQRPVVVAIDTDWTRVADRAAEMREVLAFGPKRLRKAVEERIGWLDEEDPIPLLRAALLVVTLDDPTPPTRGARKNGGGAHEESFPVTVGGEELPDPVPAVGPAAVPQRKRPAPYVGFTDPLDPGRPLRDVALRAASRYWFWFRIALDRPAAAIDSGDEPLPALAEGTPLQVVLFGYPGEIELPAAGLSGRVRLADDGTSIVVEQPAPTDLDLPADHRATTLFFSITTPVAAGTVRLRCNVYHRQNLLQSRLITAAVAAESETYAGLPRADIDYAISSTLSPQQLEGLGEQRLSLLLNQNSDDTHGLRFVGASEFRASSRIGEGTLTTSVKTARAALHRAAWGSPDPWDKGKAYRYQGAPDRARLFEDLGTIARAGWRLYFELCDDLAGERAGQTGEDPSDRLQELMRTPGSVHVALRQGAKHVLPAAMLYDRYLDDQKDFTICPAFAGALDGSDPLSDNACFQGSCPSRGRDDVVCPSGFWGYRHRLGLPVNVEQGDDAPTSITAAASTAVIMCVSDDFKDVYTPHRSALAALGADIKLTDDRNQALHWLGAEDGQIVYFFCHGDYTQSAPPLPALRLKSGGMVITASNLGNVRWSPPRSRPLVIMNGCHTVAHDPETILGFVDAFVKKCRAVGVIGTEITIFPSLARAFGEELLGAFLSGRSIGEAVRHARLALLHRHQNPLGLVYIPYVCNGVQLRG